MIQLKRVYEKPSRDDGLRVLVERLWPRGLTCRKADPQGLSPTARSKQSNVSPAVNSKGLNRN